MQISRKHALGKDEACRRVESITQSLASKYGLQSQWDGDCMKFSGTGVDGRIAVSDDSIDIDVSLGFALKMLESTIKTSVEDAMDRHLS